MLHATIQKLNFKDQSPLLILRAPDSFQPVIGEWKSLAKVQTRFSAKTTYSFVLIFVQAEMDVEQLVRTVIPTLTEDAVCWVAYPKQTSKRYTSTINRDHGWSALGEAGFEPVRQVAIDEDWSALRFRQAAHIRTMTRRKEMALSAAGKRKTQPASSRKPQP